MMRPGDPDHHEFMRPDLYNPPCTGMKHMTFFWSNNAEILFSGWPGTSPSMYLLALIVVFVLAFSVEWLSHCRVMKPGPTNLSAGMVQTLVHLLRMGLAYLVMLAIMSFNVGVLLVAVAGHTLGFMLFGSRIFKKPSSPPLATTKTSDLPPSAC
ncbi:hypothetical protein SLEP1_g19709 [Rubroshorea leprosula]|uniref:Copper transport protein n=1 Tax=Rubroshorea leprosula TaxID=152421 RepID=A0AAV5J078_9ROSI|nr:hypothetical protein SLEP1_g19709 [Rubroshorea leprosula]